MHGQGDGVALSSAACAVFVGDIRCEQVFPAGVIRHINRDLIQKLNDVLFSVVAVVHFYSQLILFIVSVPSRTSRPIVPLVVHAEPELIAVYGQLGSLR